MKFSKRPSMKIGLCTAALSASIFAGCGGYGSGGTGGGGGLTPSVVTGLTAAPAVGQINLTWNASSGATGYYVKRSTTSGAEAQIATQVGTSYPDTAVTGGTKYFYVVAAYNSYGTSANSSEVSATSATAAVDVTITVDPTKTKAISPYIYGTNFYAGNTNAPALLTLDRAGGNRWTAYNWINNGSNAGSDYFYENDNYLCNGTCNAGIPAEAVRMHIAGDQQAGLASLVTLQMQGYVSKDTQVVQLSPPFTIPDLSHFRPTVDKKSNISSQPFTLTPPAATTDNNVYLDEFAWALDQKFPGQNILGPPAGKPGVTSVIPTFISLDNEPDLWNSTHQEIQGSTNVSSDTFISKTAALSEALKDQFPSVLVFGPVNYGFNGIYGWQGDSTLSPTPSGTNWFADKYVAGIKTASTAYGKPVVDVYDFHWYSEATDGSTRVTNMTGSTLTDAQVQAIVQSPRSLWDSKYKENSWITNNVLGGPIYILRRLQAKIESENPGMKIAITEYENGGFNHIAGTIAQADNLGIFGSEGVFAANFWPPSGTYDYAMGGFRAFRGFDGASAVFGDTSLQSTSSNVSNAVVYASADSTTVGHYIFVAINRSATSQVTAINGVTLSGIASLYQITAASALGQNPIHPVLVGTQAVSGNSLQLNLPAMSVTTIEIK
jgi:hypothetical protein